MTNLPPPHPYDWALNTFKGYGNTGDWFSAAVEMHRLACQHLAEVQSLTTENAALRQQIADAINALR